MRVGSVAPAERSRAESLGDGEVHLWWAFLDLAADGSGSPAACLSADERARAAGIASERPRRRWVASRATLRRTLAPYVGLPPERLAFARDRRGRPFLRDRPGPPCVRELRFSLAHSADLALVAVGRRVRPGVDVELVRPLVAPGPLVRRVLAPAERAAIEAAPAADRPREILLRWVAKEARLKALGAGLGVAGSAFRALERGGSTAADPDPVRAAARYPTPPGRAWLLRTFEPEPGYVAALAADDRRARVRLSGRTRGAAA